MSRSHVNLTKTLILKYTLRMMMYIYICLDTYMCLNIYFKKKNKAECSNVQALLYKI